MVRSSANRKRGEMKMNSTITSHNTKRKSLHQEEEACLHKSTQKKTHKKWHERSVKKKQKFVVGLLSCIYIYKSFKAVNKQLRVSIDLIIVVLRECFACVFLLLVSSAAVLSLF